MTTKTKLKATAPAAVDQSEEIAALKKEVERLRGILKFHLGKDFS